MLYLLAFWLGGMVGFTICAIVRIGGRYDPYDD